MINLFDKRTVFLYIICSFTTLLRPNEPSPNLGLLNLGVQVQDEEGENIENAEISVTFSTGNPKRGSFNLEETSLSLPDKPVRFTERAFGTFTSITKEGYWRTYFNDDWPDAIDPEVGWYYPETRKDLSFVLRKVRSPRPLYVHNLDNVYRENMLILYEFDKKYGFDLTRGDLVRPYGRGVQADLFFTMTGEVDNEKRQFDVVTTISFPNEGDGIFPVLRTMVGDSQLLLGQEAPKEGYKPTFQMRSSIQSDGPFRGRRRSPTEDEQKSWEGMWFRTHTELDPLTGEAANARHGKIYANLNRVIDFGFNPESPRQKMRWQMQFIYFYAPDHSRSLEFNGETLVPNGNLQGVDKR